MTRQRILVGLLMALLTAGFLTWGILWPQHSMNTCDPTYQTCP